MPILRATSSASLSVRPATGSMATLWIFSGVFAATSSMSMPPSELAISVTRCATAVDHHADVELLLDVGTVFDQQAPHLLAVRAGLVRDELHAEDLARVLLHLVLGFRHLDTAALAAATRMDLRLHDPDRPAKGLRRRHRLVDGEAGYRLWSDDAVPSQDFLRLIFVDLHLGSSSGDCGGMVTQLRRTGLCQSPQSPRLTLDDLSVEPSRNPAGDPITLRATSILPQHPGGQAAKSRVRVLLGGRDEGTP